MVQVGEGEYSRELCGGTHVRSHCRDRPLPHPLRDLQRGERAAHRGAHGARGGGAAARARPLAAARSRRRCALARAGARRRCASASSSASELEKALKSAGAGGGGAAPAPDRSRCAGRARRGASPARRVLAAAVEVPDAKALLDSLDRVQGRARRGGDCAWHARSTAACISWRASRPALVERGVKAGAVVEGRGRRSSAVAAAGATPWRRPADATRRSWTEALAAARATAIAAARLAADDADALMRVLALDYGSARCGARSATRPARSSRRCRRAAAAHPARYGGDEAARARARGRAGRGGPAAVACAARTRRRRARRASSRRRWRMRRRGSGSAGGDARRALHHAHGPARWRARRGRGLARRRAPAGELAGGVAPGALASGLLRLVLSPCSKATDHSPAANAPRRSASATAKSANARRGAEPPDAATPADRGTSARRGASASRGAPDVRGPSARRGHCPARAGRRGGAADGRARAPEEPSARSRALEEVLTAADAGR